jgi:hypothetical protein
MLPMRFPIGFFWEAGRLALCVKSLILLVSPAGFEPTTP